MGRELRMVPPHWEHPQEQRFHQVTGRPETRYKPLYDTSAEEAWEQWQTEFREWLAGEHDRIIAEYGAANYPKDQPYTAFCAWHGNPPDPDYCRPHWADGEATWFQVYETVSEGTPVTPPFATREELIEYLVANGDFWDQSRRAEGCTSMDCSPWSRKQAEVFVNRAGWAPSLIADNNGVRSGVQALAD